MPLYTFECTNKRCGYRFDRVYGVNRIQTAKPRCPVCGKRARRVFVAPQLIDDTLPEGEVAVTSLRPLEGDTRAVPRVNTRSGLKRLIDGNNARYGLEIEHAR